MDGSSRVDVELVRRELGAGKVKRAGADLVRETTGYAIGGVPPFGHRTKTRVLADRGLLDHDVVWAAAGTPYTVFPLDPKTVIGHAGGTVVDVREQSAVTPLVAVAVLPRRSRTPAGTRSRTPSRTKLLSFTLISGRRGAARRGHRLLRTAAGARRRGRI